MKVEFIVERRQKQKGHHYYLTKIEVRKCPIRRQMKVVPIAISSTGPPPPPLQAFSLCTDRHYSAILHRETVCHIWSTIAAPIF